MARNTPQPVRHIRGVSSVLDNYTGPEGELVVDTTNKTVRVQDGSRQGGHPLVNTTMAQTVSAEKTFTDSPLVPTAAKGDNSTKAASTEFVDRAVADIDVDTFPKTSKDNLGSAQIGYGLAVTPTGVVSLGLISTPSVIAPTSGAEVMKTGSLTVETSPFSVQFGSDTHISTDYLVTTGSDRSGVVLQAIGSTDKTSHTFADLSGLTDDATYYIHVRHNGANSSSAWSAPVNIVAKGQQITPTGRGVYRHPSNKGSVIVYDEFGVTKNLFVFDAAYRARNTWGTFGTDVPGLNNWTHSYYPTCTGNVIDSYTGYTDLSTVADLTPYKDQLTDAHFQAALTATLAPVIQSAKAATDILMNYYDTNPAHWCRTKGAEIGIEGQLPNSYQLLVMFAEGDVIDSLDPTLAANPAYALGWNGGKNTYRWRVGGSAATWSSTEYGSDYALLVRYDGVMHQDFKVNSYGVAPVAEI